MPKNIKNVSPLAKRLRAVRVSKRLTQQELADLADVSVISIVRMEQDSTSGLEVLGKIEQALEDYQE